MCNCRIPSMSFTVTNRQEQISLFTAVWLAGEQPVSAREPTSANGQFAIDERHEPHPKRTSSCILFLSEIQEFFMSPAVEFTPVTFITEQVCSFRDSFKVDWSKKRRDIRRG